MSNKFNTQNVTKEDCIQEYNKHMDYSGQGYYRDMQRYANTMSSLVGESPFSKEGWAKILKNDGLFNKAVQESGRIFSTNKDLQKRHERLLQQSREVATSCDTNGYGLEGWGGGSATYASSLGAFAMGATPFIIGGWLAGARSEEIYQQIENQNKMRLEFEYNIDYLQIGETRYFYPQAFRSGEITGYNKLPKVDWVTPWTDNVGTYTAPEDWCGEDMFILLNPVDGAPGSVAKGNFLEVSKRNVHKFGVEPNCKFSAVQYKDRKSTRLNSSH